MKFALTMIERVTRGHHVKSSGFRFDRRNLSRTQMSNAGQSKLRCRVTKLKHASSWIKVRARSQPLPGSCALALAMNVESWTCEHTNTGPRRGPDPQLQS